MHRHFESRTPVRYTLVHGGGRLDSSGNAWVPGGASASAAERRTGPAKRHEFTPTVFYRQFSAANKPVLTVAPGDTIHTTTVDAGGTDEKGVTRVLGGNPETGPFYIETAMPGDTLVVHLT